MTGLILPRRAFLASLAAAMAAPAIVRAESLMKLPPSRLAPSFSVSICGTVINVKQIKGTVRVGDTISHRDSIVGFVTSVSSRISELGLDQAFTFCVEGGGLFASSMEMLGPGFSVGRGRIA